VSPVYQWQLSVDSGKTWRDIQGATAASYQGKPTDAGSYWYRCTVTDQTTAGIKSCRIASNNIVIIVHKKPMVSAGPDRVILKNDTLHLAGSVSGDNPNFTWHPTDGLQNSNQLTPAASPVSDMSYTLSAISQFGCSNEDAMTIKVLPGIFIPTAFTPNNDGKNDQWRISLPDQIGAEVNVYNRWGQLIYHASVSAISWDGTYKGKEQPTGVYVFQVQLKKQKRELKGTVTLIR
jgi:gliding motility-associated-like protein